MVGQYLHPLHGVQAADEVGRSAQAVLVIGQAGHQHMADPQRHAQVGDVPGHGQDVGVVLAGEPAVALRVDLL